MAPTPSNVKRQTAFLLLLLAGCGADPAPGALAGRAEVVEVEERTVALAGRTLVLDGFAGEVRVETGSDSVGTRIRFERRGRGATEASARARLAAIALEEGQDDELVQYVWRAAGTEDGLRVDAVATVPPGARVVVRTGAGGIAVDGPLAELDAETRAGGIVVGRASARRLRLLSAAGDVALIATTIPAGAAWDVETRAGSVDFSSPPGASVRVEADTEAGRADVRGLDGAAVVRSGAQRLVATLGAGAARVRLHTQAGDVTLGPATDIDGTETGQVAD